MTTPEGANPGVLDLAAVDRELRREDSYVRTGHTARTLIHAPGFRVVQVTMKAGGRIPEHRTDLSATILVLKGQIRLRLPSTVADLGTGQLLLLEGGVPHDVEAVAEAHFLLTLGGKVHA